MTKIGTTKSVSSKGTPKIGERWGPVPLRWGRGWPPPNTPLLVLHIVLSCWIWSFYVQLQQCERNGYLSEEFDPVESRLSRSIKVVGTDTDGSAAYDFLLTFHSNHIGLSRTVSEINGDFSRKSQIFPLIHLTPPVRGFPLEWGNGAWV